MNTIFNTFSSDQITDMIELPARAFSDTHDAYNRSEKTMEKFSRAAFTASSKERMGMELDLAEKKRLITFSVTKSAPTKEDLLWIFGDFIEAKSLEAMSSLSGNDRADALNHNQYTYAFSGGFHQSSLDYDELDILLEEPDNMHYAIHRDMCKTAVREMNKARAKLYMIAGGDEKCYILISLPEPISLRLRTMCSMAFGGMELSEHPESMAPAFFEDCAAALLASYLVSNRWKEVRPDDTLLCDLKFSVRTYNCLRRAGVDTLGQLRAIPDQELRMIKNLGQRSIDEIHAFLDNVVEPDAGELEQKEPNSASTDVETQTKEKTQVEKLSPSQQLEQLIGLLEVKQQVKKLSAFARMKSAMAKEGQKSLPMAMNMVFEGNPGTAKTTVARILAGFFHETGLLKEEEIMEVGRADLVASYIGQTAPKVKEVFENARGKLLFIDEAYSLADAKEGEFGDEAINTIVQEMENHRDETVVVFAGYPDRMKEFFSKNPGLRSRVPFQIQFPDYAPEEMRDIVLTEAKRRGFAITAEAVEKVLDLCAIAAGIPVSGNGRFCRNLVEAAILNYAYREYGETSSDQLQPMLLLPQDFELPKDLLPLSKPTRLIGFCA